MLNKILLLCIFVICNSSACALNESSESVIGLHSLKKIDHQKIRRKFVYSESWVDIVNKGGIWCKFYTDAIKVSEIEALFVMKITDFIDKGNPNQSHGASSIYFSSCNYLQRYSNPIFNWGKDENKQLKWIETDAYFESEHTVVLLDFLTAEKISDLDPDSMIRVLFIEMDHQLHSNKKYGKKNK